MWRMFIVGFRLVWPYLLTPWRSPLLRWRMETFGICDAHGKPLQASSITPAIFWHFMLTQWTSLLRFVHWASRLNSHQTVSRPPQPLAEDQP